jgi:hypothetical protein
MLRSHCFFVAPPLGLEVLPLEDRLLEDDGRDLTPDDRLLEDDGRDLTPDDDRELGFDERLLPTEERELPALERAPPIERVPGTEYDLVPRPTELGERVVEPREIEVPDGETVGRLYLVALVPGTITGRDVDVLPELVRGATNVREPVEVRPAEAPEAEPPPEP